jgi:hypothetical protein
LILAVIGGACLPVAGSRRGSVLHRARDDGLGGLAWRRRRNCKNRWCRLEKRIQEVEYLYRIETTIRPGRADLQVGFQDYAPQDKVPDLFYQVRKRMQDEAGHLPQGVIGPLVNDDFSDVYFKLIALTAPGMPMRELTREAEAIRDRLQRTTGMHKAIVLGERAERVYLEFDNARWSIWASRHKPSRRHRCEQPLIPAGRIETDGPRSVPGIDADLSDPAQLRRCRSASANGCCACRTSPPSAAAARIRRATCARGARTRCCSGGDKAGENGLEVGKRLTRFVEDERARLLGITFAVLTDQAEAIAGAVNLFQFKFRGRGGRRREHPGLGLRAGLVVASRCPHPGITSRDEADGHQPDRITPGTHHRARAVGGRRHHLRRNDAGEMEQGWTRAAAHAWSGDRCPMLFGTLVTVAVFPIGFANRAWRICGQYLLAGRRCWCPVRGRDLRAVFVAAAGLRSMNTARPTSTKAAVPPAARRHQLVRDVPKNRGCQYGGAARAGDCGACRTGAEAVLPRVRPPGSAGQRLSAARQQHRVRGPHHAQARGHPRPHAGGQDLSAYGAGAPRFFISANPEPPDPAFAKLIAVTHDATERDKVMAELEARIARGEFAEARVRVYRLLFGPPVIWPVSFRVVGADPLELRRIAHQVRRSWPPIQHP